MLEPLSRSYIHRAQDRNKQTRSYNVKRKTYQRMRANADVYVRASREFNLAFGAVHQRRICVRRKPEVQADLLSPM